MKFDLKLFFQLVGQVQDDDEFGSDKEMNFSRRRLGKPQKAVVYSSDSDDVDDDVMEITAPLPPATSSVTKKRVAPASTPKKREEEEEEECPVPSSRKKAEGAKESGARRREPAAFTYSSSRKTPAVPKMTPQAQFDDVATGPRRFFRRNRLDVAADSPIAIAVIIHCFFPTNQSLSILNIEYCSY